jgi:hypothetical protein
MRKKEEKGEIDWREGLVSCLDKIKAEMQMPYRSKKCWMDEYFDG